MPSFTITTPDGASYDVTAPDQRQALDAVSKLHPTKPVGAPPAGPPSTMEDIKKDVLPALQRTAQGIAGLPAAASQALDYIPSAAMAWGAEKLGMLPEGKTAADFRAAAAKFDEKHGKEADFGDIGPPTTEQIGAGVQKATGQTPLYEPQTFGGKVFDTGVGFAPGAIGPAAGIAGRVAKNVIAPTVGTEVAGKTAQVFGLPEGPARLVGGLGSSVLAHGLTPRPNTAVVEAGGRQGVDVPAGVASDNPLVEGMGAGATKMPWVGTPLDRASQKFMGQLGTRMDTLASEAAAGGQGATRLVSGMAGKNAIQDWITGESAIPVKNAYTRRDNLLTNPQALTPLSETQKAVGDITNRRYQSLLPDRSGPAVREVQEAAKDPSGLTVQGIQGLRTRVRQLQNNSMLPEAWDKTELSNIYTGLTKDLEQAHLNAGGQPALDAWKGANRVAESIAGRRQAVAKIVGEDASAAPEKVFDKIANIASDKSGGDLRLLAQARQVIGPNDWQELASGVIGRLGRTPEGDFSASKFLNSYDTMSEGGKNILFRRLPTGDNYRQSLDDIATLSSKWKQAQRFANPSGSGHVAALAATAAGLATEPTKTLAALVGGRVVGQILANPVSTSSLAKWSTAYGRYANSPSPTAFNALAMSSRNLSKTLKDDMGVDVDPQGLLGNLSAVPGDTGGGRTPLQ